MSNLHDICKKSGFCTPETRKELAENGFNFSICAFGIATKFVPFYASSMSIHQKAIEAFGIIAYPTLEEILKLLPYEIDIEGNSCFLDISKTTLLYEDVYNEQNYMVVSCAENLCEAACQLWLKLKKGGFLNG